MEKEIACDCGWRVRGSEDEPRVPGRGAPRKDIVFAKPDTLPHGNGLF